MRIAIIGGGPIGMEAALYGVCAGYEVQLYERGRLAENVRQWGHIGLFTEWARNRSPLAVRLLSEAGRELPDASATSSGDELADYILQLASLPQMRGRVAPQSEVISVTRERCLKSDFAGDPRRAEFPFRILLRGAYGEKVKHFDAVIDATGVYATPNPMGNGGAPCVGETAVAGRIDYHLPDVAGRDRARFANRHTTVIGSGHSAASTLRSVGDLFDDFPQTRVTWIVRRDVPGHGLPFTLVPNDSSPHRDALHRRANELAQHPFVTFLPRTVVESVSYDRQFRLGIKNGDDETSTYFCDNIAAHTGFRPDRTLWSELQVEVHPATDGPRALSSAILEQNRRSGTGLSTGYAEKMPDEKYNRITGENESAEADGCATDNASQDRFLPVAGGPALLHTGEPNFYILGIKSYGRDAGFLMHNGFRQVRDAYKLISGDDGLDLYDGQL
ncbi:MAG TPA: FAD-dependent oxidoreductase [Abditibacteriaceae bacterium]